MHPNLRFGEEHQPRAMLSTMPAPSSRRTSNRGPPIPMPPKSINGAGASVAGSALAGVRVTLPEASNDDRQRWNKLALIPSRRQNSGTDSPLLDCRENSSRHIATLRLIRLIFPIVRSSC
jgi:hypothetical protein